MSPATSAYAPLWRLGRGALVLVSRTSIPLLLLFVLLASDPPVTELGLIRWFTALVLAPGTGAWVVRRAFVAESTLEGGTLTIRRRGARLEVPASSIVGVVPWRIPLPGPGLDIRLASGRSLPWVVETEDPLVVTQALGRAEAAANPTVVWAHARRAAGRSRWDHPLFRFGLFGLVPTALFFNVHQYIAYGGTWGQWYLEGPGAWLTTLAIYWAVMTIYLVLYAGVWRGIGEVIAFLAAIVAPSRAARVRRAVEVILRIAFYAGVPALVAMRFLS